LTKDSIDIDSIISTAEDLKYSRLIKEWFAAAIDQPSVDFVRLILSDIYEGTKNQKVIDKFTPIVKRSVQQYINDTMNSKIKSALNKGNEEADPVAATEESAPKSKIETTLEELEGFGIVKAILLKTVDADRIDYRDTESYFGILLDNNSRKWICRLCLNGSKKFIQVSDESKNPVRYDIETLNDIYKYASEIETACAKYL
jgi:hypothetical protein